MFPLAGKTFPQSAAQLTESIQSELSEVLTFGKQGSPVTVDAPKYPHVNKLKVELSGAKVTAQEPPPRPEPVGKRESGIEVDQLEITAHPIQYQMSKVDFDLTGKEVRFDFARDQNGNSLLVLSDAAEGKVDVNVSKADLQSLAMAATSLAAKQQGVTILEVDVELASRGKRIVSANIRVKAKKIVSGVVHVTGQLEIDDELNATFSDLACSGEGMIGSMVAGLAQPKLKAYNGKKVALMAFSLGDLALRDLNIDVTNGLHVAAGFGKPTHK